MKLKKKRRIFSMLLETLSASILGNALAGRGILRADESEVSVDESF